MQKTNRTGKKQKYWTVEDWKKVLFSDDNHFFRSRKAQQVCHDQEM